MNTADIASDDGASTADASAANNASQRAQNVTLDDFRGCWEEESGQRATMTIAPREGQGDTEIVIHWAAGVRETMEWISYGAFDEVTGTLSYTGGTKKQITREGAKSSDKALRNDGEGALALMADGTIRWVDTQEKDSDAWRFVRTEAVLPTIDELIDGYFRVVGGYQAEAEDAAARQAHSAYEAVRFALWNDALSQSSSAMQEVILTAWESMSAEEQQAFTANFAAVMGLIDTCLSGYEGARRI